MANRFRNERIEIKLTKEEKEIFEKKMKLANYKTMSHFLMKCVLEKEIYVVDLEPFRNLQWLLSNVTNNINQIAKATNTTGIIYKNEIESMNNQIEKLSREIWQIHSLLLNNSIENLIKQPKDWEEFLEKIGEHDYEISRKNIYPLNQKINRNLQ